MTQEMNIQAYSTQRQRNKAHCTPSRKLPPESIFDFEIRDEGKECPGTLWAQCTDVGMNYLSLCCWHEKHAFVYDQKTRNTQGEVPRDRMLQTWQNTASTKLEREGEIIPDILPNKYIYIYIYINSLNRGRHIDTFGLWIHKVNSVFLTIYHFWHRLLSLSWWLTGVSKT